MTQEELKALYDKQNTAEGYSAQQKLERLASKKADIFTSEDEALLEDLDF